MDNNSILVGNPAKNRLHHRRSNIVDGDEHAREKIGEPVGTDQEGDDRGYHREVEIGNDMRPG